MNNPFQTPTVRSIHFDVGLRDAWLTSSLESVRVESGPLRAGDTLRVALTLSNYLDAPTVTSLDIPIPPEASGETLTLFLGDADAADALDRGLSRQDFKSLADVVSYLAKGRSRGALYVKLLRSSSGVRVEGASLPSLPPSVQALYDSPKNVIPETTMSQSTVWETSIPVPGEYTGRYTMPVKILP